jgi:hypothetical protein
MWLMFRLFYTVIAILVMIHMWMILAQREVDGELKKLDGITSIIIALLWFIIIPIGIYLNVREKEKESKV